MNHAQKKTALLCAACKDLGYTERDLESHLCKACNTHKGRKKFAERAIQHKKEDKKRILACLSCTERETTLLALIAAKTPVAAGDVDFLRFRPSTVKRISRDQFGRLCYDGNVIGLASIC
jgi:hypothetical protein